MAHWPSNLSYSYCESPVGPILLAGHEGKLHCISFRSGCRSFEPSISWVRDDTVFDEAISQIIAYFAGDLREFDLPLYLAGTQFQRRLWAALREIPYGTTTSYGVLAAQLGNPKASRAVGAANGANPLPIIIPCHRVVGANRSLTGFGGGVETKKFLLEHEQEHFASGEDSHPQ